MNPYHFDMDPDQRGKIIWNQRIQIRLGEFIELGTIRTSLKDNPEDYSYSLWGESRQFKLSWGE